MIQKGLENRKIAEVLLRQGIFKLAYLLGNVGLSLEILDDREREVLALRFGGDLTGPEIAELTGLTVANVQQILSRMLRKLREALESPAPVQSGSGQAAGEA